MIFANRTHAGKLLADALAGRALADHAHDKVVIYALPRGGMAVAAEIAAGLGAPLDIVVARKIGHPSLPEFAIAAVNEEGWFSGSEAAVASLPPDWIEQAKAREWLEARRRREEYAACRPPIPARGKTAIIVDDGAATGLSLRVAIEQIRRREPERLIAAVPVAPRSTVDAVAPLVDDWVALVIPDDDVFLGSVGAYYEDFAAVSDDEVARVLMRAAFAPPAVLPAV